MLILFIKFSEFCLNLELWPEKAKNKISFFFKRTAKRFYNTELVKPINLFIQQIYNVK